MPFSISKKGLLIWFLYIVLLLPIPTYFCLGLLNKLGADPIRLLEHKYGELALIFLLLSLSISPLFKFTKINLIKYRRCLGLVSFYYVVSHISIYLFFDIGLSWELLIGDLQKRYFIIAGFVSFLFLIPLAVTSSDRAIKRLSVKTWRALHKLVFIVLTMSIFHFILLSKTWTIELLTYAFLALLLIIIRLNAKRYFLLITNIFKS